MKKALLRALTIGAMSASAMAQAADLDLQKVYDVLQAPLVISTKASLLQIQDNRIVATYGVGAPGLTAEEEEQQKEYKPMEDCRQVAVRQALLDATLAGDLVKEISRKNSHRVSFAEGIEGGVRILVGLKVTDAAGADQKRTFTYIFSDAEEGACKQIAALPVLNDNVKKKDVENDVLTNIIPKFSDMERQARYTSAEIDPDLTDAEKNKELADKMVAKVLKYECAQVTLNRALELSGLAFKAKFGSNPIVLIDWEQSRVKNGEQAAVDGVVGGKETDLYGNWIVRMVDRSGTQAMKTQLSFGVQEDAAENCSGSIDSAVTELN